MNYGQPTAPPPYDGYGTNQPYPQYGPAPYPPPQVGFSQYGPPPPPGGYYPSQPPPQAYLPANAGQYGSAKVVQQPAPVVVIQEQPRQSTGESLAKDCCLIALCLSLCCCCLDCCD